MIQNLRVLRILRGEIHRSHFIVNASVSYDSLQILFAPFAYVAVKPSSGFVSIVCGRDESRPCIVTFAHFAANSSSLTAGASAGRRAA